MVLAVGCAGFKPSDLIRQRLGLQPIGFYDGLRVLDQGIGQDGACERIVFVQLIGFAQQLNGFSGLLLRE